MLMRPFDGSTARPYSDTYLKTNLTPGDLFLPLNIVLGEAGIGGGRSCRGDKTVGLKVRTT